MSLTLIDNEVGDISPTKAKRPAGPVINDIFLAQQAVRKEGHELARFTLHPKKFERLLDESGVSPDQKDMAMRAGIVIVQGIQVIRIGDAEGKTDG